VLKSSLGCALKKTTLLLIAISLLTQIKAGIEKLRLELRNLHCECSKRKGGRERETKHSTQCKYPNESLSYKPSSKFYPWYNLCFSILVDTVEIDVTSLRVVLELSVGW